jgi:hypothetical protein
LQNAEVKFRFLKGQYGEPSIGDHKLNLKET